MAREITIMTPEQVEVKFELAGIGSRCVAMIIDTLWQSLVGVIFAILFLAIGFSFPNLPGQSVWFIVACILVLFLVEGGYFLYFEATKNGQTPGKKSAGIRVVRDTGHPVDFRSALLRNVMRIIDLLPGSYGVAVISVFFSPEYRRLGDYVGGTLVVKVGKTSEAASYRAPVANPEPAQMVGPIGVSNQAASAPAGVLPVEAMPYITAIHKDEYRALRHFLDRRLDLEARVVHDLSKQLAEPIAVKLHMELAAVEDYVVFLDAVSKEWERRVIH